MVLLREFKVMQLNTEKNLLLFRKGELENC